MAHLTEVEQARVRRGNCADCDTAFTASSSRKVYCDPCAAARNEAHYARMRKAPVTAELTCEHCGTTFTHSQPGRTAGRVTKKRFCSQQCAGLGGHPGNVDRVCKVCDQPFTISAQFDRDTCSRRCQRWDRIHPDQKPATECGRCGKAIDRPTWGAIYCSHLCAAIGGQARRAGRTPRVIREFCLSCGGPLPEGCKAGTMYCSRNCQAIIGHERRAAKIRGARVERVYPVEIYERDEWQCHLCHAAIDPTITERYHPERVSLDHLIPVAAPDFPGHVWENVAAAHLRCNIVKGHAVTAEDRAMYERLRRERAAA